MRVIDGLKLFAVVGAISWVGAGAANAAEVTKFKSNGNTASSNSNDGTTALDLSVTRDDTNTTSPVVNFFFNRSICDSDSCDGTFGFGTIPSGDFNAGAKSAKLNTNLATNSGYSMFSFHQDLNTGEFTQTPITPTGVVIIEWKQVPRNSSKFEGTTTLKAGSLTTITKGTQYHTQASVIGSFAASPIVNAVGNLGSNKNANITIIRE